MNKKILMFSLLGVFALALVSAVAYYSVFSTTFNVSPAVSVEGNLEQVLGDGYFGGETISGEEVEVFNDAPSERVVTISNDAPEEISVAYTSELELSKKVVVFGESPWDLIGKPIMVEYTLVGDELSVEVEEIEGYVLVYYKDNSDRFDSPAQAILIDDVEGNLPYEDDTNIGEYDYCATGEYLTCHGAKIWYVPEEAVDGEGNINWGLASDFYFETELIQYNAEGQIIVYPDSSIAITPQYTPSDYADGEYEITTTVA